MKTTNSVEALKTSSVEPPEGSSPPVELESMPEVNVDDIKKKHVKFASALAEYSESISVAFGKFRPLLLEARAAKLLPWELTATLFAEGWVKTRVAEFKTIVEAPDKVFNEYMDRLIGFRAALTAARAISLPDTAIKSGKAYEALAHVMNTFDLSLFGVKPSKYRLDRLGVTWVLTVRRKPLKAVKKAAKRVRGVKLTRAAAVPAVKIKA